MANNNYNRMSGKEYRKEHDNLTNKIILLQAEIADRLLKLCSQYPDAPVKKTKYANIEKEVTIYAKGFATKQAIDFLSLEHKIEFIETIENHIADLHPHKQLKIDFNSK